MIKVYYESNTHAELVAIFDSDELYNKCSRILRQDAKENKMIVTENVVGSHLNLEELIGEKG